MLRNDALSLQANSLRQNYCQVLISVHCFLRDLHWNEIGKYLPYTCVENVCFLICGDIHVFGNLEVLHDNTASDRNAKVIFRISQ